MGKWTSITRYPDILTPSLTRLGVDGARSLSIQWTMSQSQDARAMGVRMQTRG